MEENLKNISIALGAVPSTVDLRLLDLGCWDGATSERYIPAQARVFGVELEGGASGQALRRGIRVVRGDLNRPLPWRDQSFHVVTSNQVIEHLSDTDTFVREILRVLRRGGLAVVSTENLSSWHNILALMLGWQAFSLTNVNHLNPGIGNPLANLRGSEPLNRGWEHLRVFSFRGLIELFRIHGFEDVRILGAGYYPLPAAVGRLDRRHSAFITVVAKRPG
jgi:SAM-dependent methyltransferase